MERGLHAIIVRIELEMCINFAQVYLRNGKINEQSNSIATGLLYVHTEFKTIWTLLPEDMAFLNPMGYRIL